MNAPARDVAPMLVTMTRDDMRALMREELAELSREPEPERLLDREELAGRLGVSVRSVDTLRGKGLPTVWVLESPRFVWDEVVAFLKGASA